MAIVWTNGCYDILHVGHISLFENARIMGTKLFVGIDSDRRVKESKGETRPINKQEDRKKILESIRWIDKVVVFDSDEELRDLIKKNNVAIMVIGSDWKDKKVIGENLVKKIVYFDRIEGYSTTNILKNI